MKENFLVYRATFKALKRLTLEQVGKFIIAYGEYSLDGTLQETGDVIVDALLDTLLPVIDSSNRRYAACVENGKKGGRPKTKNNQTETKEKPNNNQNGFNINNLTKPKDNLTDTVTDTVTDNDNEIVPECINTRKQKEYDGNMIKDSSTRTNNKAHNNFEKEKYDVNEDTSNYEPTESEINEMFGSFEEKHFDVNEGTSNSSNEKTSYTNTDVVDEFENKVYKCIDKFKAGIGIGIVPTKQQLAGYMFDNNVQIYKSDFSSYPINDEGKQQVPYEELGKLVYYHFKPMVKTYGYILEENDNILKDFIKHLIQSEVGNSLNVEVI